MNFCKTRTLHGTVLAGVGRRALSAALVAAGAAALSPLRADTYQFIVSGYPAANERYAAASAATTLATATRAVPTAPEALEARYRTWDESDGIPLRSDKPQGVVLIFR